MKQWWNSQSKKDRILGALTILLSAAVIVLVWLQIAGIWSKAIHVFEPLMGLVLLLQASFQWNRNRWIAIFNLCAAVFIFICAVIILVIP